MAFSNNMTSLVNKIERRLGLLMMKLPDTLNKNTWAENVIIPDTLVTFSRYYPQKIKYKITSDHKTKNGWIYIDEEFVDNHTILGIKDIDWSSLSQDSLAMQQSLGYGSLDYYNRISGFTVDDILDISMMGDYSSFFSSGLFVEFEPPNRFRLVGLSDSDVSRYMSCFTIDIFVTHSKDLTSISPTMMEIFEDLCIADVAGYIYHSLKYMDNIETAYTNIDLKLDYLEQKSNERESIIERIRESYVSASNQNQPLIITI